MNIRNVILNISIYFQRAVMATGVRLAKQSVDIVRLDISAIKLQDTVLCVRLDGSYHCVPVCVMFLVPLFCL